MTTLHPQAPRPSPPFICSTPSTHLTSLDLHAAPPTSSPSAFPHALPHSAHPPSLSPRPPRPPTHAGSLPSPRSYFRSLCCLLPPLLPHTSPPAASAATPSLRPRTPSPLSLHPPVDSPPPRTRSPSLRSLLPAAHRSLPCSVPTSPCCHYSPLTTFRGCTPESARLPLGLPTLPLQSTHCSASHCALPPARWCCNHLVLHCFISPSLRNTLLPLPSGCFPSRSPLPPPFYATITDLPVRPALRPTSTPLANYGALETM